MSSSGFRGFGPALGGGALLAALAALVVVPLFASAPAEARWNVDPCQNLSQYPPPAGERTVCGPEYTISGWGRETPSTPTDVATPGDSMICDESEAMAGAFKDLFGNYSPSEAHWDFWAERGEWVTWTGQGKWRTRTVGGSSRAVSYSPELLNWYPGGWRVRIFINCTSRSSGKSSRSRHSHSERTHTDGTMESGDSGGDAVEGGGETDVLVGEGGGDALDGAGGDDDLFGNSGEDTLNGGRGEDYQLGGSGGDTSRGGGGDDQLLGGTGDDEAYGGRGSDELFDNEGREELHGGRGDDRFSAHDRSADLIRCGQGEDVVVSDRRDRIAEDCEHVYRTKEEAPRRPPTT